MAADAVASLMSDVSFDRLLAETVGVVADATGLSDALATALVYAEMADAAGKSSRDLVRVARAEEVPWQVIADAFGIAVSTAYARFTPRGRRESARRQREWRARHSDGP